MSHGPKEVVSINNNFVEHMRVKYSMQILTRRRYPNKHDEISCRKRTFLWLLSFLLTKYFVCVRSNQFYLSVEMKSFVILISNTLIFALNLQWQQISKYLSSINCYEWSGFAFFWSLAFLIKIPKYLTCDSLALGQK